MAKVLTKLPLNAHLINKNIHYACNGIFSIVYSLNTDALQYSRDSSEHILISDNIKDSINDQEVLTNCFSGQFTSIIGFTREIYYFLGESPSLEA